MIFYHGTTTAGIKELGLLSKTHDEIKPSAVYLTPNRSYALFYIRDIEVNHVTCCVTVDGYIRYDEQFPNQLRTIYKNMSGYLYKCLGNDYFEKTATRDVWVSKKSVPVAETEFIPDVYEEILKNEAAGAVKVNRYELLTNEQKQDIYDMIVHYIYKLDLIKSNSKKAEFFHDNFPDAWNYAEIHPEKRQTNLEEWDGKHIEEHLN